MPDMGYDGIALSVLIVAPQRHEQSRPVSDRPSELALFVLIVAFCLDFCQKFRTIDALRRSFFKGVEPSALARVFVDSGRPACDVPLPAAVSPSEALTGLSSSPH